MILFIGIALLIVLAATAVLVASLRSSAETGAERARINVAIFREREAELARDRAEGRLDDLRHEALLADLRRLLVDDVDEGANPTAMTSRDPRTLRLIVLVLVPLLSFAIYLSTGFKPPVREWLDLEGKAGALALQPDALSEAGARALGLSRRDVARLTQASLPHAPEQADEWLQLGITWLEVNEPALGLDSVQLARRLAPDRSESALALAHLLLAFRDGRLDDEIRGLFDEVLQREPQHQGALMSYGMAAFENGDYALAAKNWRQLLAMLDPASEGADLLKRSIARAESRGKVPSVAGGPAIRARISLPDGTAAPEGAVLFVIVKSADGPPMPLAVRKITDARFPVEVSIGDGDLLSPGPSLSERGPIELRARLSRSGDVMPVSGDRESRHLRLDKPSPVVHELVLDRVVP